MPNHCFGETGTWFEQLPIAAERQGERSYRIQNLLQQVSRDIPVLKNGDLRHSW